MNVLKLLKIYLSKVQSDAGVNRLWKQNFLRLWMRSASSLNNIFSKKKNYIDIFNKKNEDKV